ncbi:unnamed protein product [Brachionus calyciflorus]|uniref:Translin-associated factor X-interacting protein 1 N-terminal domain-containing protein n=1 Tax=Brachionus calyciflorus TaxID=104777 RepID=A0A814E353_9BILA|nr:unnamed protein product [Brachionus calyciflorus]
MDLNLNPLNFDNAQNFITYLNSYLDQEISYLDKKGSLNKENRDRFLIFKEAFNQLINYVQIYRDLLIRIKSEYEFCIEELERQNAEVGKKVDEIKKYDTQATTISNLELRKAELLEKFSKIKEKNEFLEKKLQMLLEKNEKFRPKKNTNMFEFLIERKDTKTEDKNENKKIVISGVNLEKATDLVYLDGLLKEVEMKIKEISTAQTQKYCSKQQKKDLEAHLFSKIAIRDEKKMQSYSIKNKIHLYKLALNTAKDFYNNNTQYASIEDALSKCLINNFLKQHHKFDDELDNSDDLGLEQEAEMILDHIEKFNDLFENGKYIDAAYFAVASPKNILRNIETLYRFKSISDKLELDAKLDPLMAYCEALIDCVNDRYKPDELISIECIKIALKYNKLETLSRWVAQKKLNFSYEAGECIENYSKQNCKNPRNSIELALFVYTEIKAIPKMALCMARLGRYVAMFDLMSKDQEMHNNIEDWLKILKQTPSIEFANLIVENLTKSKNPVPIDRIVSILLDSDQPENGLKFLKDQIIKISNDESKKDEVNKLKASYETLVKFSFLAQDEDQFTKETALKSRDQVQNLYSLRSKTISFKSNPFKNKLKQNITEESNENKLNRETVLEEEEELDSNNYS